MIWWAIIAMLLMLLLPELYLPGIVIGIVVALWFGFLIGYVFSRPSR